jgi:hypothetical protein
LSGRIVAQGTFAELKGKYAALMSQINEQNGEEEEDEEKRDGIAPLSMPLSGALQPSLSEEQKQQTPAAPDELPPLEDPSSSMPTTPSAAFPSDKENEQILTLEKPHRTRTVSSGTTAVRPRKRLGTHKSSAASMSRSRAESDVEAKQLAAAKAAALLKNAPKSALIEKEGRATGAVAKEVWLQYFSGGDQSWRGAGMLVRRHRKQNRTRESAR